MQTFSQLVDSIVLETRRPDLTTDIARWLNQTVRECHFDPESGNALTFKSNLNEERITATLASGQTWVVPDVSRFQTEMAFRFDNMLDLDGYPVYAKRSTPGKMMEREFYMYYQVADTFVFGGLKGYGGIGATLSLSWFEFAPSLKYFASGSRPAVWDDVNNAWVYAPAYDVDATTRQAAQDLVTHWMIQRWTSILEEGLRAKVYKRLSDEGRQRTSYSLYQQLRRGLVTSELIQIG